jgi:hypothetical protein
MEELTIYPFWDGPKLDFILFLVVMGQSKMPMTIRERLNFGSPHN